MPITITTDPPYPVVGESVELTITGGTAYQRGYFKLSSAPNTSTLEPGVAVDSRYETAGDEGSALIHHMTPDVGGPFTFQVDVYTEYRVPIREAPSAPVELRRTLDEKVSGTVHVGAWFELPIRTIFGHGATLGLLVVNGHVREVRCQGFLTDLSRSAFLETATQTAYEALVDLTIAGLDEDLQSDLRALCGEVIAHFSNVAAHNLADTKSIIRIASAHSARAAIELANAIHDALLNHLVQGTGGTRWHVEDDGKNMPIVGKATTLGEAVVLRADLRERVYERHRAQIANPSCHVVSDSANTMSAASPLMAFIVAFLDAIAAFEPATVPGESDGHLDLQHALGFSLAD
jgi:hypothetical protein